jgi:hypothetical protein
LVTGDDVETRIDRDADAIVRQYVGLLDEVGGDVGDASETATYLRTAMSAALDGYRARYGPAWVDGLARAVARLVARRDEIERRRDVLIREYNAEARSLTFAAVFLDDEIGAEVIRQREATDGAVKSINVPGVGRWQSREKPGGWRVTDADTLVEWLTDAERAEWGATYIKPPEPPKLKLDRDAFLAAVEKVIEAGGGEQPPGVEQVPDEVTSFGPFKGV